MLSNVVVVKGTKKAPGTLLTSLTFTKYHCFKIRKKEEGFL